MFCRFNRILEAKDEKSKIAIAPVATTAKHRNAEIDDLCLKRHQQQNVRTDNL